MQIRPIKLTDDYALIQRVFKLMVVVSSLCPSFGPSARHPAPITGSKEDAMRNALHHALPVLFVFKCFFVVAVAPFLLRPLVRPFARCLALCAWLTRRTLTLRGRNNEVSLRPSLPLSPFFSLPSSPPLMRRSSVRLRGGGWPLASLALLLSLTAAVSAQQPIIPINQQPQQIQPIIPAHPLGFVPWSDVAHPTVPVPSVGVAPPLAGVPLLKPVVGLQAEPILAQQQQVKPVVQQQAIPQQQAHPILGIPAVAKVEAHQPVAAAPLPVVQQPQLREQVQPVVQQPLASTQVPTAPSGKKLRARLIATIPTVDSVPKQQPSKLSAAAVPLQPQQVQQPITQQQPIVQQQQQPITQQQPIVQQPITQQQQPITQQQPIVQQPITPQQQPIVQQQPLGQPIAQQPIVQKPIVSQHPIVQQPITQQQPLGVGQTSVKQGVSGGQFGAGVSMQQQPSAAAATGPGLSSTDLEGVHAAHRRAEMKARSLESSAIQLRCERPSMCGIDQSTSLYDAILRHTDLSVEALHLALFDMYQPIRDVLQSPQCNITVTMPAADAILAGEKYKVAKYCRQGKWRNTEPCKLARARERRWNERLMGDLSLTNFAQIVSHWALKSVGVGPNRWLKCASSGTGWALESSAKCPACYRNETFFFFETREKE
jgi:hypothetical protein